LCGATDLFLCRERHKGFTTLIVLWDHLLALYESASLSSSIVYAIADQFILIFGYMTVMCVYYVPLCWGYSLFKQLHFIG
jgi:hypothetical protein